MSAKVITISQRTGYFIRIHDTQLPTGRKTVKAGVNKRDAESLAARIVRAQDLGEQVEDILADVFPRMRKQVAGKSLEALVPLFLEWREQASRVRPTTLKTERMNANQLARSTLGKLALEAIRVGDISTYVRFKRKQGRTFQTVQRHLTLLSTIYGWAQRERRVRRGYNPVRDARAEFGSDWAIEKREVGTYLDAEQVTALLQAADEVAPFMRAAITLALHTLLRRSELVHLEWRDIEAATGKAVVRAENAKNKNARVVPLNQTVLSTLDELRAGRVVPLNGPDRVLADITFKTLRTGWLRVTKAANLSGVRWHDLRHSGTALLLQAGVPPAEVIKIAGWRTSAMLDRYSRFVPSAGSTDALDRMFG